MKLSISWGIVSKTVMSWGGIFTNLHGTGESSRICLAAKTYGYDLGDWTQSSRHLSEHLERATLLDDADLKARSLYFSGDLRMPEKPVLAHLDLEGALKYAKLGDRPTKGAVNALASVTTALTAKDMATRSMAEKLLEEYIAKFTKTS